MMETFFKQTLTNWQNELDRRFAPAKTDAILRPLCERYNSVMSEKTLSRADDAFTLFIFSLAEAQEKYQLPVAVDMNTLLAHLPVN